MDTQAELDAAYDALAGVLEVDREASYGECGCSGDDIRAALDTWMLKHHDCLVRVCHEREVVHPEWRGIVG